MISVNGSTFTFEYTYKCLYLVKKISTPIEACDLK